MKQNRFWGVCLMIVFVMLILAVPGNAANAQTLTGEVQSAGIAAVIGLDAAIDGKLVARAFDFTDAPVPDEPRAEEVSLDAESFGFCVVDAESAVNIREQPDEEATQIGIMYKDNGGRILARENGWTKLSSGDLTGWAKDDYLLFDDDAAAAAKVSGTARATVVDDVVRVRAEAKDDAEVLGYAAAGETLAIDGEAENGFLAVSYGDITGYVLASCVDEAYHPDEGLTIAQIRKHEKDEADRKAKEAAEKAAKEAAAAKAAAEAQAAKAAQTQTAKAQGAAQPAAVGGNDTLLLASLIYCEAGNQPHDGKVAVGAVVMNRLRSGAYPNSLYNVIYQPGQFTPARSGKVASVMSSGRIPQDCINAAAEAMAGASPVGGATQFRRAGAHAGMVIGSHVFW